MRLVAAAKPEHLAGVRQREDVETPTGDALDAIGLHDGRGLVAEDWLGVVRSGAELTPHAQVAVDIDRGACCTAHAHDARHSLCGTD